MKKLLFILLGFCFFSCGNDNDYKNDWSNLKLNDKVKLIIEKEYTSKSSYETQDVAQSETHYLFNLTGNLIDESLYKRDGTIYYRYTHIYNENGNLIKVIAEDLTDGDRYDKFEYKYDENGNRIEKIEYSYDGTVDSKNTYKYDGNGNIVEEYLYNNDYNDYTVPNNTFKYDKKGNIIENFEHNEYVKDGVYLSQAFKYDGNGNTIEINGLNSNGSITSKNTYKYDGNRNIIKWEKGNESYSTTWKFEYEYDKNSNWIKCFQYYEEEKEGKLKTTREIVYF